MPEEILAGQCDLENEHKTGLQGGTWNQQCSTQARCQTFTWNQLKSTNDVQKVVWQRYILTWTCLALWKHYHQEFFLLCITDAFSKCVELVAIPDKSASEIFSRFADVDNC
jgi:hypothetical protein